MSLAHTQQKSSFTHHYMPAFGKKVHRLGLAVNYGLDEAGVELAFDRGVNYIFLNTLGKKRFLSPLKRALRRDREHYIVTSGPTLAYFGRSVRKSAEKLLRQLETDYLDLFQLYWLGITSAYTDATLEELLKLKEEGKVRAIGVSIHDRKRAGLLAKNSPLDLLMIRYNASHPGAEQDIFPYISNGKPAILAYTATDWRRLLRRPKRWTESIPTAGDCYRFCLTNPYVDLVLTGPANQAQLTENLAALEKGPLSEEELSFMRRFGKIVHG